jgi:FlaA1/EpsC-like NDP-sugar epimerase
MFAVVRINILLAVSLTAVMYLFQEGAFYSRMFFLCFFLLNILTTYLLRQYFKLLLLGLYKKSNASYKVMIITTSDQVKKILTQMHKENEWEYQVTYLTLVDIDLVGKKIYGVEVKAGRNNMFEVARQEVIDGVFIHIPNEHVDSLKLEEIVLEFQNMGITVDLSIHTFGLKIHEKVVREVSGYHVLTSSSISFSLSFSPGTTRVVTST